MDSTLGAVALLAKVHAVRLFSLLRHDIDRAEKCGDFCSRCGVCHVQQLAVREVGR